MKPLPYLIKARPDRVAIDNEHVGSRVRWCGCGDFAYHVLVAGKREQVFCCVDCGMAALRAAREKEPNKIEGSDVDGCRRRAT